MNDETVVLSNLMYEMVITRAEIVKLVKQEIFQENRRGSVNLIQIHSHTHSNRLARRQVQRNGGLMIPQAGAVDRQLPLVA